LRNELSAGLQHLRAASCAQHWVKLLPNARTTQHREIAALDRFDLSARACV
jgi:hypothetical protein